MEHFERVKYSAVLTVAVVGITMLIDMLSPLQLAETTFSLIFIVPAFVILYLFAPFLSKFIKYK